MCVVPTQLSLRTIIASLGPTAPLLLICILRKRGSYSEDSDEIFNIPSYKLLEALFIIT